MFISAGIHVYQLRAQGSCTLNCYSLHLSSWAKTTVKCTLARPAEGTHSSAQRLVRTMHQLRCDWIHMPDIREQETQTCIYIHISSPGAGFTLYASEIMVGSSSKLSRIKTHRTNITSIDFYLGLFLTIFHKSILLRNPLCPLNIAKNVPVESFWHALFPILPYTLMCLKRPPQGTRMQTLMGTLDAAFVKCHYFISQTLEVLWDVSAACDV